MTNDVRTAQYFSADEAPEEMLAAAEKYQLRFGTKFAAFAHFSRDLLMNLQAHSGAGLPPGVRVGSAGDPSIVRDMAEISMIANLAHRTAQQRSAYRDALVRIYRKLPVNAAELAADPRLLCVGPDREGRQLAEVLGCLPGERAFTPCVKRIPFRGGILVGTSEPPATGGHDGALIIDGMVASGATVMALLTQMRGTIARATLLTAHSTVAGVWALHRYAALLGLEFDLVVGHVSGELGRGFHANDEKVPGKLVLGDIGDTISGLPAYPEPVSRERR